LLHVAFELLVCRAKVKAHDEDPARSGWIFIGVAVCPLFLPS